MRNLIILLGLLLLPSAVSAQDVSPHCEAAMDRAAGHYSKCLLSADASYARHGNATKLANRQARCETRFDRRTSRAINRHGADECPSSDLVAAMEDRTVTYAEGVATEASGMPALSYLFVQNGTGGTLSDTTLTLTGVSSKTGWFTDRPYREAGQVPTEEFVSHWNEGQSSDPPNADFTCEVGDEAVNYVVELTSPVMAGGDLSYAVTAVGDTVLPETTIMCEGESNLFIDSSESVSPCAGEGCLLCIPCYMCTSCPCWACDTNEGCVCQDIEDSECDLNPAGDGCICGGDGPTWDGWTSQSGCVQGQS